jgi:hypothetical protein
LLQGFHLQINLIFYICFVYVYGFFCSPLSMNVVIFIFIVMVCK